MKNLMNLSGAKALNEQQQREIFGGVNENNGPLETSDGGGGGGGGCDKKDVTCDFSYPGRCCSGTCRRNKCT